MSDTQPPIIPGYAPKPPLPPHSVMPAPTARPSSSKKWPILTVVGTMSGLLVGCVGGCLGGVAIGSSDSNSQDTAVVAASSPATTATTPEQATEPATPAPPPSAPASPEKDPNTITDEGVLLVPSEVKPGTYRATVPEDSFMCYWSRLSEPSDVTDAIIDWRIGGPGKKMLVTIEGSDRAFKTDGCGPWTKVG